MLLGLVKGTGYGQQIAEFLPLIAKEGYPTAMIDFTGLEGGKLMLDGVLHYPKLNHVYGSDALIWHGQDFKADVCFTLQDQWVLNPEDLAKVNRYIPMTPIDHEPVPKPVLEKLRFAYRIVTYSQFGQKELSKYGIGSTYISHSVNTEVFKPMDKIQRKLDSKINPKAFLIGMVAANKDNPPRKCFQEALDAFKLFLKKVPNALMYIHSHVNQPGGFPIMEYANFIGVGDKILYPDLYQMQFNIDKEKMALIYNTFDVFLLPSFSEGFGVPLIEAQACGVPCITTNFTSMPELIIPSKTGELIDIAYKRFDAIGSYVGIPSTNSIYKCLMKVFKANRKKMGKHARNFVVNNYETKKVFKEKWVPFLQTIEDEIYGDKIDHAVDQGSKPESDTSEYKGASQGESREIQTTI